MVDAATAAVAPLANIELAESRTCDAQELPFEDGTFDVVVANHMLYHVPDPGLAAAEFARVLTPSGVLIGGDQRPRHLDVSASSPAKSSAGRHSTVPRAIRRRRTARRILESASARCAWHAHPSTLVCTDPEDVYAFIISSPAGHESTPEKLATLQRAIEDRFATEGGSLTITTEAGCLVAAPPGLSPPQSARRAPPPDPTARSASGPPASAA